MLGGISAFALVQRPVACAASLGGTRVSPAASSASLLGDPTVLFLIFVVAAVCLYLELAHPGAFLPGIVGTLALIAFLVGSYALGPNYIGLPLMLLSIALLVAEVRVFTYGALTVGALIALGVGSFLFFDTGGKAGVPGVSPEVIGAVLLPMALIALVVSRYALRSRHGRLISGSDGLVGRKATVTQMLAPEGRVRVLGEDWAAYLSDAAEAQGVRVEEGQEVRVLRVEGLKLIVEPVYP